MSKNEVLLMVSRAVAIYLFCWSFDALSYLPERLLYVEHSTTAELHRIYMLESELTVLRGVVLLGAAMLLFECGPRVQAFLLPEKKLS